METITLPTGLRACYRATGIVRPQLTADWFKPNSRVAMEEPRLFLRNVLSPAANSPELENSHPDRRNLGRVLTVNEAAERLRISRWMLYRLIQQRKLSTFKLGSRRLVPESAVWELVDKLSGEEAA